MSSASASTAYTGQRWEYTCQRIPNAGAVQGYERRANDTSEFLNQQGANGWEIVPYAFDTSLACFKRPG
jgi:hypothetical protein